MTVSAVLSPLRQPDRGLDPVAANQVPERSDERPDTATPILPWAPIASTRTSDCRLVLPDGVCSIQFANSTRAVPPVDHAELLRVGSRQRIVAAERPDAPDQTRHERALPRVVEQR